MMFNYTSLKLTFPRYEFFIVFVFQMFNGTDIFTLAILKDKT